MTYSSYTVLRAVGLSTSLYHVLLNVPKLLGIWRDQDIKLVVELFLSEREDTPLDAFNRDVAVESKAMIAKSTRCLFEEQCIFKFQLRTILDSILSTDVL